MVMQMMQYIIIDILYKYEKATKDCIAKEQVAKQS